MEHLIINEHTVRKPASVRLGCVSARDIMGNLNICDIQALEQHMLLNRQCLFQIRPCCFQQDSAKPHLHVLQQHGSVVKELEMIVLISYQRIK